VGAVNVYVAVPGPETTCPWKRAGGFALEFVKREKLCGTESWLLKLIVTLAPAETVIVLILKDMFFAIKLIVTGAPPVVVVEVVVVVVVVDGVVVVEVVVVVVDGVVVVVLVVELVVELVPGAAGPEAVGLTTNHTLATP